MVSNKHISRIVIVIVAVAALLCFLAMVFSDKLTELLGGTVVKMEYESELFDTDEIIDINIKMDEDQWNKMLDNAMSEKAPGQEAHRMAETPEQEAHRVEEATGPEAHRMAETPEQEAHRVEEATGPEAHRMEEATEQRAHRGEETPEQRVHQKTTVDPPEVAASQNPEAVQT